MTRYPPEDYDPVMFADLEVLHRALTNGPLRPSSDPNREHFADPNAVVPADDFNDRLLNELKRGE